MDKFLNFLSLAKKSNSLLEGYSKCDDYRNNTTIHLFIMSNELSDKSKSKFKKHCESKNIPYIEDFSKEDLGNALGRKEVMLLGVLDKNIAKKLLELYEEAKYMGIN